MKNKLIFVSILGLISFQNNTKSNEEKKELFHLHLDRFTDGNKEIEDYFNSQAAMSTPRVALNLLIQFKKNEQYLGDEQWCMSFLIKNKVTPTLIEDFSWYFNDKNVKQFLGLNLYKEAGINEKKFKILYSHHNHLKRSNSERT